MDLEARRILTVDPGTTTGVAWATIYRDDTITESILHSWATEDQLHGGLSQIDCHDENEGVRVLVGLIRLVRPDLLVIEDFILQPPKGRGGWSMDRKGLSPVRIDSKLDWEFDERPVFRRGRKTLAMRIDRQMPSERTVITDERLRGWKLWRTPSQGGGAHAMDATRHLVVAARKLRA